MTSLSEHCSRVSAIIQKAYDYLLYFNNSVRPTEDDRTYIYGLWHKEYLNIQNAHAECNVSLSDACYVALCFLLCCEHTEMRSFGEKAKAADVVRAALKVRVLACSHTPDCINTPLNWEEVQLVEKECAALIVYKFIDGGEGIKAEIGGGNVHSIPLPGTWEQRYVNLEHVPREAAKAQIIKHPAIDEDGEDDAESKKRRERLAAHAAKAQAAESAIARGDAAGVDNKELETAANTKRHIMEGDFFSSRSREVIDQFIPMCARVFGYLSMVNLISRKYNYATCVPSTPAEIAHVYAWLRECYTMDHGDEFESNAKRMAYEELLPVGSRVINMREHFSENSKMDAESLMDREMGEFISDALRSLISCKFTAILEEKDHIFHDIVIFKMFEHQLKQEHGSATDEAHGISLSKGAFIGANELMKQHLQLDITTDMLRPRRPCIVHINRQWWVHHMRPKPHLQGVWYQCANIIDCIRQWCKLMRDEFQYLTSYSLTPIKRFVDDVLGPAAAG